MPTNISSIYHVNGTSAFLMDDMRSAMRDCIDKVGTVDYWLINALTLDEYQSFVAYADHVPAPSVTSFIGIPSRVCNDIPRSEIHFIRDNRTVAVVYGLHNAV